MTAGHPVRILVVTLGRRGGVTEYGWLMTRALSQRIGRRHLLRAGPQPGEKGRTRRPKLEVRTFTGPLAHVVPGRTTIRTDLGDLHRTSSPMSSTTRVADAWKLLLDLLLPRSAVDDPRRIRRPEAAHRWDAQNGCGSGTGQSPSGRRLLLLSESSGWHSRRREGGESLAGRRDPHGVFDDYSTGPKGSAEVIAMTASARRDWAVRAVRWAVPTLQRHRHPADGVRDAGCPRGGSVVYRRER